LDLSSVQSSGVDSCSKKAGAPLFRSGAGAQIATRNAMKSPASRPGFSVELR
jgi:hypothetical protein